MTTVFLCTWRKIWRGWLGWAFTAAMLLATGITAYAVNLSKGVATFTMLFSVLPQVLIPLFPVAACAVFTQAKHNGEDAWLSGFAIPPLARFAGRFLALYAMFLVPTAAAALLPFVFSAFGEVLFARAFTALAGYLLFGAAWLAVSAFIASETKNRALAVLVGSGVGLVLSLTDLLAGLMERTPLISALIAAGFLTLIAMAVWHFTKRILPTVLTLAVPAAALVILAFAVPLFLTARLPGAIHLCSPFARLAGFLNGHFAVPALLFDLSVCGLFAWLAAFRGSAGRATVRRAVTVCAAVVLLVGLNVGTLFLPYRTAYPDTGGTNVFRLSKQSREALATLDEPVTLRYFSNGGWAGADPDLYSLVLQYAEVSRNVRVELVNTATDPDLRDLDEESLAYLNNAVQVSSRRSRLILPADILYYSYAENGLTVPLSTADYARVVYTVLQNGGDEQLTAFMAAVTPRLSLERMLTNAVFYVSRERAPRVAVFGTDPDGFLNEYLTETGFALARVGSLDALAEADVAFLNLSADLTADQRDALIAHLQTGGRLFLMGPSNAATPNINAVLAAAGASLADGTRYVDATGTLVANYNATADGQTAEGGRLVFIGVRMDSIYNAYTNGAEFDYIARAFNWLADADLHRVEISDPAVPSGRLTPGTTPQVLLFVLLVLLLPAGTVGLGALARYVRRRKIGY